MRHVVGIVAKTTLWIVLLVSYCRAEAPSFFVAPDGQDGNPGTQEEPFGTLERARDAVREHLASAGTRAEGAIVVSLRGGTYRLTKTVVFGTEDSGSDDAPIVYTAYPGETPVLSGSVPISDWKVLARELPGLPPSAAGKVWVAELPRIDGEVKTFTTLFDGDVRLPRARGAGFVPTVKYPPGTRIERSLLHFPANALRNWDNLRDAEILIRPTWPWTINYLGLEEVDEAGMTARTSSPGTYALGQLIFGLDRPDDPTVWVENVIEALDEPGEWVVDSAAGKIYLIPRGDTPGDAITAPVLTELIRIEGEIDYDGPTDVPVRNIVLRGITFTQADRFAWEKDRIGWGLQHDWEMFDRPTALVRLRGAESCAIEGCRFHNSGGTAIRLDLHCRENRIVSNDVHHIGGAGILLAGYGPGTKDVNTKNAVLNNHIHHVGELLPHSAAIFAWQSGENRIAHNLIHHTPYTGIIVSGRIGWDRGGQAECSRTVRWHEIDAVLGREAGDGHPDWRTREQFLHGRGNIVELNEIQHVMEVMHDGNCIYISGTGANNVVRRNYLHHNVSPYMCEVIRCDDDQHDTLIESNMLYYNRGSGITIKGVNHIVNNVIAMNPSVLRAHISLELGPLHGSRIQRNIVYSRQPEHRLYFQELDSWLYAGQPEPRLRDCDADYNLYFNTVDPEWGQRHLERERPHGVELNSLSADPRFADIDNGDLSLREDSPAWALGFQKIDIEQAGLYRDTWRTVLPDEKE